MGICNEELLDPVVFFCRCCLLASAAALLRAILRERLRLHIAGVRQRNHHILWRNQIFRTQVCHIQLDRRTTTVFVALTVLVLRRVQLIRDDGLHAFGPREDVEQIGDLRHYFFVLVDDLVLLETCQALQTHLQNFLCLIVRQLVHAVALQTIMTR